MYIHTCIYICIYMIYTSIYIYIYIYHISIDICIHNNMLHNRSQDKINCDLDNQCLIPDVTNNRELWKL